FLSDNLVKFTLTIFPVIEDRFVNHIPTMNTSFVAGNDRMNVVSHAFNQHLTRDIFSRFVRKKPSWRLRMPYSRVSDKMHIMLFTICDKLVGIFKIERPFSRLHKHALHTIFGYNRIKLLLNDLSSGRVTFPNLIQV